MDIHVTTQPTMLDEEARSQRQRDAEQASTSLQKYNCGSTTEAETSQQAP
jgi:hypothetical protein